MTNVYALFEQDQAYQDMLSSYHDAMEETKAAASKGVYDPAKVREQVQVVNDQFHQDVRAFHARKFEELEQKRQAVIQEQTPVIDYHAPEAKTHEVTYRLADDAELRKMVQHWENDDLLAIHLLRLELKTRGLAEEENDMKHYTMRRQLETPWETDERYHAIAQDIATLNMVKGNGVVMFGQYKPIGALQQENVQIVEQELANPSRKVHGKMDFMTEVGKNSHLAK